MTVTLVALAGLCFALAAGLFGVCGIILFWLIMFAVAFLLALLIALIELGAALIADRIGDGSQRAGNLPARSRRPA